MENEVMVRDEITEKKITEYLDSAGITNSLLENEKKLFINIAREFGLNPFKREIHITAYGQGDRRKCSIITGYDVYIKRAERTGKLDGWKVWTEGEGKNLKAMVEIYRKDHKYPFVHEVYYTECCQYSKEGYPNQVWAKMPRFMTKKVAIGQAFRLCFPDDLGGMPYEEAEIVNGEMRNVTETNVANEENGNSNEKIPENKPQKPVNEEQEKAELNNEIGKILKSVNPSKEPYFSETEIDEQRDIFNNATSLYVIREQHKFLAKVLSEREKKYYDSIPFEDNKVPSMYNEPEKEEEPRPFQSDIPAI